jgi:hypothetical protein
VEWRRHARRAMATVAALSLASAAACQWIAGIDSVSYVPSDSGPDVVSGKRDVASCPDPADCTNPACIQAGYQCLPLPHEGGVLVAAAFDAGLSCPPGYGAPAQWFTAPGDAAATCSCGCVPDGAPSCNDGILEIVGGPGGTCSEPLNLSVSGPGCTTSPTFVLHTSVQLSQTPSAMGGACHANVITEMPSRSVPVGVCAATQTSRIGCPTGQVCALNRASATACVKGDLPSGCGVGYGHFRQLARSVDDTRSCQGTCQCAPPSATCAATSLSFFLEADCGGPPVAIETNGQCGAVGSGVMQPTSFEYVGAATDVTCGAGVGPLDAAGGVVVKGATTFCCAE